MVRYTGLNARLGNASKVVGASSASVYNIELIGDIEDFDIRGTGEVMTVPSLGNPYLSAIETARVRPELSVTFHPQNTSYLNTKLIVQTGTNLSAHFISYLANSADYGIIFDVLPSRVEVNWAKNAPVTVRANLIGTSWSTGLQTSTGNYSKAVSSTEPIMSEQLTSVHFHNMSNALVNDMTSLWRRGSFTIDYRTVPIYTGVGVTPSDVLEGIREVTGFVEVSVNESRQLLAQVSNTSALHVEIGFMVAPMSTTYYFYSSTIKTTTVTVPGTDIQRQRIEWQSKFVTRSSM